MDVTITMDEVASLVGPTLPSTNPQPNFKNIRTLHRHIERALQTLPWVATQVAALTYQSQLTQLTAATTGQRQKMQLAQFAAVQEAQYATMHQLIEGLKAVAFNVSNAGHGFARFGDRGGSCGR